MPSSAPRARLACITLLALSDNVTVSLVTAAATVMAALIVLMQRDSSKQAARTREILSSVAPLHDLSPEQLTRRLDHTAVQINETAAALNIHRETNVTAFAQTNQLIGKLTQQVEDLQVQMDRLQNTVALISFAQQTAPQQQPRQAQGRQQQPRQGPK
jgi:hypothetical protein